MAKKTETKKGKPKQPKQKAASAPPRQDDIPQPFLPNGLTPNQFQLALNDLTLKQMNANLALTYAQIQHNQISIAAMRTQAYVSFLSELRMLTTTYQVDIENTIMMSEPKYKPLFDGQHVESLQDTILKVVAKLKTDLEIK